VLLILIRGELAVLPAVTAVLLHHNAMEKCIDCNVVTAVQSGNCGSACSYFSTVTSQYYGYMG